MRRDNGAAEIRNYFEKGTGKDGCGNRAVVTEYVEDRCTVRRDNVARRTAADGFSRDNEASQHEKFCPERI